MPISRALYSSKTDDWETPRDLFARLNQEFHFTTDVCAIASNAKCSHYFSPKINGLSQKWKGVVWCNPPYGKTIGAWVKKAYESSLQGATVVCLLPARTDTAWWWDYCVKGEIRYIRGRLRFGDAASVAPFPSAIIVFRRRWWEEKRVNQRKDPEPKGGGRSRLVSHRRDQTNSEITILGDVGVDI